MIAPVNCSVHVTWQSPLILRLALIWRVEGDFGQLQHVGREWKGKSLRFFIIVPGYVDTMLTR